MKTKQLLFAMLLSLLGIFVAKADSCVPNRGDKIETDDGVYVVAGDNIIPNADFSQGLTGWKAGDNSDLSEENFQIVPDGGPDGCACLKALGGAGSGTNKTLKTGWAVEAGKTYVFSVWAYRTQSGMSSNTQYSQIWLSNSETSADTEIDKITFKGNTWVENKFVFTADKPYFVVKFAWLNAASSFAGFFLAEVEKSQEIVTTSLETSVTAAEEVYNTTEEGDEKGQYTTDVRKALADAIAAAKDVMAAPASQEQVKDAKDALDAAVKTYKGKVNPPFKIGVGYTVTNVAGSLSLTSGDGTVRIATPDFADSTQVFYFVPAPEGAEVAGYNLRDANGTYIWRSGSWDTKSGETTLTAKNAIFNVVDYGTFVQIKNEGSGSVLGVDNTKNNSEVYSNKGGTGSKNNWVLTKHTPTASLEMAIEAAETVAAGAEVGTEYYQVPQSAIDELNTAIAEAKAVLPTIADPEAAEAAVSTLKAAVEKFKGAFNPLPDFATGESYTVTHYGECLLTATTTGNATITTKAESGATDAQLMTFEKASYQDLAGVYYVKSVADGTYLVRDGSWDTKWRADRDTVAAIVQITRLEGKWLGLKFVSTATFLGTDARTNGASTYSDKAGVDNHNAYWTIDSYVAIVLDREAFKAAVAKAEEALADMKPGYKTGEYFQEDIDAFAKVVSKAKSDANKAQSQEALDAVTAQLLTDVDTYVAKKHDHDYLNVTALKAEVDKADKVLKASVAGDCNGQYPEDAISAFSTALTTAKAVLENVDATQNEIDAAVEALKNAEKEFDAAKVSVSYADLKDCITEAQQVVAENVKFVGDGPGKYSVESYEALKKAIEAAQAVAKSNAVNQQRVNEETETLQDALNNFYNSFRANDYSELQALVSQAEELIRQAEAGEIVCTAQDLQDLKESYANNAAALDSQDQNVIDKAAKLLRRDIDIFKTMTSGISLLPVGVTAKVYTMSGVYVGDARSLNLAPGVYVVRYNFGDRIATRKVSVK